MILELRQHVVLVALFMAVPCLANHPLPGPHYLRCEARGRDVVLSWDDLGISPDHHEAQLYRDKTLIAVLEPDATSHRDEGAPLGRRVYRLDIIQKVEPGAGQVIASLECGLTVLISGEVWCEVFGGGGPPPSVLVTWDPLPPEVDALGIDVQRDGELVANLAADALEFQEEPLQGEHLYTIIAVLAPEDPAGGQVIVGECLAVYQPPRIGGFVRGDANGDGSHDLSDAVVILFFLFQGPAEVTCASSADADDSGETDVTDAIYVLSYLFTGGPQPPPPFLECGDDPTPDALECQAFARCFNPPPP